MQPIVIKLSGKALAAENELLTLFKALQEARRPFILVHGGGVEVARGGSRWKEAGLRGVVVVFREKGRRGVSMGNEARSSVFPN